MSSEGNNTKHGFHHLEHRATKLPLENLGHKDFSKSLKNTAFKTVTPAEIELLSALERNRPEALRDFDQIPMLGTDLLCQIKLIAPLLANKSVAFVGDHDGSSLLLGLLSSKGFVQAPARMTLLDFDERLLAKARGLAKEYGFHDLLETRPYNVFHPEPTDLKGQFDAFYTNPPYGASNGGESARLFIVRGCNLTHPEAATGYMLLPSDAKRPWTQRAMYLTQYFFIAHGWRIMTQLPNMHRYHLDDDKTLTSSLLITEREFVDTPELPWTGRYVNHSEIPNFYGKSVLPPYPHFISEDGHEVLELDTLQ